MPLDEITPPCEGCTSEMAPGDLAAIVTTEELERRPKRPRDVVAEADAMSSLASTMSQEPEGLFQRLADLALVLCRAHSAGVSLLETNAGGVKEFRWRATAGKFAPLVGQTLPRHFSPCGVVLDRDALQLMTKPVRYFTYVAALNPPVEEVLLVPFHDGGTPVGTLWVVSHDEARKFDGEDARLATRLSVFASAAWQAIVQRRLLGDSAKALQAREREHVRAEAELAEARKRSESAMIAGEVGVYRWDVVANRLTGDRNFLKLFGITSEESEAAPLEQYMVAIHPEDRASVMERVRDSVETGADYEADYRVLTPAGLRWVTARGRMQKDDDGRVVGFHGVVLDITTRKLVEEERQTIAERLRRLTAIHETVLSAMNDFAYVFDLSGRFAYANRPLLELYGRSLDQVVGKTFYELDYPTWLADRHTHEIAHVVATKQPVRGETAFTGANGVSAIYDYIFTPVFGADGEVELVAGTTRDVTDRRRAQDRDRLLVALDDATRPLTEAAEITEMSARFIGEHLSADRCAYADVEEDGNTFNLTGDYNRGVPSIVGRYRFDQFGEECLRLMRAGQPYVVTDVETDPRTENVRDAYRRIQIRSVICVPMLKAGHFVAAMAVHQTAPREWLPIEVELVQRVASRCWESIERTRVMRVLAKSEQQLRLAVETGRLGIWELQLPAQTLVCSPQCKVNYGRAADMAFGYEEFVSAVHPDDLDRVLGVMARCLEDRSVYDMEYRVCWPDGSVHWVLARGQASYSAEGRALRMIGVSLDITARKEAEREQVRLREEADRASRAKDEFLATLSHELRTPLNPVLLVASDAARDPAIPDHARATFEMIRKNVELEARLIDDLLDLTGIARGKIMIRRRDENLHAILRDALAMVRSDFEQRKITLDVQLDAACDQVLADAARLVQVFLNLLKNAAKFTPADGRVTLRTSENDDRIVVRLSDSGIGMTEAEIARAFGAFEQGDHAANLGSRRFGGLGLGLAISRRLVEMHGGRISALSPGREQGSTFIVELPLRTATPAVPLAPPVPATTSRVRVSGEPKRILLVEDHEPTRKTLEQLLRRRNFSVVSAASVHEANLRAAESSFDLLVSDLGLPDGDGAELMASMRDRFGLVGIALTGYGMEQDVARCRAAGFLAHLTKPIRVESLESALAEVTGAPVSRR